MSPAGKWLIRSVTSHPAPGSPATSPAKSLGPRDSRLWIYSWQGIHSQVIRAKSFGQVMTLRLKVIHNRNRARVKRVRTLLCASRCSWL